MFRTQQILQFYDDGEDDDVGDDDDGNPTTPTPLHFSFNNVLIQLGSMAPYIEYCTVLH